MKHIFPYVRRTPGGLRPVMVVLLCQGLDWETDGTKREKQELK